MLKLKLTRRQADIAFCQARFQLLAAGRRFGKTYMLEERAANKARHRGHLHTYVTPLSAQGLEVYQRMISNPRWQHLIAKKRERPFPQIWWRTGARTRFKSMQRPENLRSTGEDAIDLDEIQDPCYTEHEIKTVIMPMLGDRRGTLLMAGQFRGHNWYYNQFYLAGQSQWLLGPDGQPLLDKSGNPIANVRRDVQSRTPVPMYASWRIPSSEGHVFQGEDGRAELELQRSLVPKAVWDQEWECIPSANVRAVFDAEQLKWMMDNSPAAFVQAEAGWRYVIGLDLGGKRDYSAYVVMAWDQHRQVGHVVHAERFPLRTLHADQAKRMQQISAMWGCPVVADNTGGATGGVGQIDAVFQHYRSQVRDLREWTFTHKSKGLLVRNMELMFEQQRLTIPRDMTDLYQELSEYEWEYKAGAYRYGSPAGKHDDLVMALGLAIEGALRGWTANHSMRSGGASLAQLLS